MNNNIRVGFIGLGIMGNPMAKNIHKAGYPLGVYNRTRSKTKEFEKLGITIYDTPASLAKESNVIISMVTGPTDVEKIYFGYDGIIKTIKKGSVVIDMSTIGVKAARKMGKKLEKIGINFIDAPVTGSLPKAISGELMIFVGGNEKVYKKILPILQVMGKTIHYIGESGSGQAIKLINNMLVAISIGGLAEGMILADMLGLPRKKIVKALTGTPVISAFMQMKMINMAENRYPLAFSLKNMHKDLKLVLNELQQNPSEKIFALLSDTEKLYEIGEKQKLGERDMATIIKVIENNI